MSKYEGKDFTADDLAALDSVIQRLPDVSLLREALREIHQAGRNRRYVFVIPDRLEPWQATA